MFTMNFSLWLVFDRMERGITKLQDQLNFNNVQEVWDILIVHTKTIEYNLKKNPLGTDLIGLEELAQAAHKPLGNKTIFDEHNGKLYFHGDNVNALFREKPGMMISNLEIYLDNDYEILNQILTNLIIIAQEEKKELEEIGLFN